MSSKTYWEKREAEALKHYLQEEQEYQAQLRAIYQNMLDAAQKEIDAFYGRYADKEQITLAEAKRRVSKLDITAYQRKAKRYVADKDFGKQANEEMRLYNLTMKVNRLEMLKANIGLELVAGHDEQEKFMSKILRGRTEEELQRQAGILGKTVRNNAKLAETIPNASFHGATYSERIWGNQAQMKADLSKLLQQGLIQGKNPRALSKDLRKYYIGDGKDGGAAYAAERLMRTELARVQTEAQRQSFLANGFEEYTFHANRGCCSACADLDGKHFKIKDMMPGKNAPPMHPNCRCSVSAYEDNAEYEAWLDFLDKGGTTEEWEALQSSAIPQDREGSAGGLNLFRAVSGDLKEATVQLNSLLNGYSKRKSKWSGNVEVLPREKMPGAVGRKNWNCSISLREGVGVKTIVHELLHARSVSYYSQAIYEKYKNIEEGTVELYAQEICERNDIDWSGSYQDKVRNLRIINKVLKICENDYDFAKELFDIEMPDRYNWLVDKFKEKQDNISEKQKRNIENLIALFKELNLT